MRPWLGKWSRIGTTARHVLRGKLELANRVSHAVIISYAVIRLRFLS